MQTEEKEKHERDLLAVSEVPLDFVKNLTMPCLDQLKWKGVCSCVLQKDCWCGSESFYPIRPPTTNFTQTCNEVAFIKSHYGGTQFNSWTRIPGKNIDYII